MNISIQTTRKPLRGTRAAFLFNGGLSVIIADRNNNNIIMLYADYQKKTAYAMRFFKAAWRHNKTERRQVMSNKPIPQLKVVYCGSVCESAPRYTCPLQVVEAISDDIRQLDREAFYVLHLDGKNRIISKELISLGSLNQSIVHPREVFKGALLNNSAAIIGVHNHPSGDPSPSREDKEITQRLLRVRSQSCQPYDR
jgi:proteasome lid subunit RPN8/RPN11